MRKINLLKNLSKGQTIDMAEHDPDDPKKFAFTEDFKRMQLIKVFLQSPLLEIGMSGSDSYYWRIKLPVIGSRFEARIDARGDVRSPGEDFYLFWHEYHKGSDRKKEDVLKRIREYPAMRFAAYFKSHPIAQAYFIGATQGLEARIPDERINPFAGKRRDDDISEKDLELALLSGALFSTMTEEELLGFFDQQEKLMRFGGGGFRAGALNRYISRYDGSMHPKKPKIPTPLQKRMTHDQIVKSPRYLLYEDELFKAVIKYLDKWKLSQKHL
ncbi:hypothetical protein GF371_01910 [Candidatus Woesearchaeota archaeon]|nr:hypothetical protein [Candidatus Woesearchaeota archaeon]